MATFLRFCLFLSIDNRLAGSLLDSLLKARLEPARIQRGESGQAAFASTRLRARSAISTTNSLP